MRASKEVKRQKSKVESQISKLPEIHISGAEGLYEKKDIQRVVRRYIKRALDHPKGKSDKIVVTIENIKKSPIIIEALPVGTLNCGTPAEAKKIIKKILHQSGISKKSLELAFQIIKKGNMRGAALITSENGKRLEPFKDRGIRATRLGISKPALKLLSSRLSRQGINSERVKEAIILASKVSSCDRIIAELCVSDNPHYTTGYLASRKFGYLRIPNIKYQGVSGGRVFFVRENTDIHDVIDYLEKTSVMINKVNSCKGTVFIDEILGHSDS